jgi:hypothetical protein
MKCILFRICLVLTLVAVPAIGSQSFAQTNLLVNPGFEDGGGSYDGWFTFGDGVQLSTPDGDNIIRTDSTASKIYGEFTGCDSAPQFDVGGYGQEFTPTVGKVYQFNGYSFVSSGDDIPGTDTCNKNRCIAKVVFWDADSAGYEISGNEVVIGDGNTVTDQWNEFSVSAIAPTGALRVEALILFLQPGCDTGSVFIDDTSFFELDGDPETSLLVNHSFTGGLTGWESFGNAWSDGRNWAVRTPTGSAKLFSSFDDSSDSGIYQTLPSLDSCYHFSVHTMTSCRDGDPVTGSNDNFLLAQIRFRNIAGSVLGAREMVVGDSTSPIGTWTKHSMIARAPEGTDSVDVYILFISPTLQAGALWVDDILLQNDPPAGVPGVVERTGFELHQNAPNPFSSSTAIRFDLAKPGRVKLCVYNVQGELVATVADRHMTEGPKQFTWDGKDSSGEMVASGIYFYRLVTLDAVQSKKMMLLR